MSYTFPASRVAKNILLLIIPSAILGVLAGFFWLHMIWGFPIPDTTFYISIHPTLMFYLVLLPFIMGVAYTLLPTFWNYRASFDIAMITVTLVIIGESVNLLLLYLGVGIPYLTFISLFGAGIFTLYILGKIRFNNEVFKYADAFILLSMLSLLSILVYRAFHIIEYGTSIILNLYNYDHLFLSGFILSLIFGVSVRTMKFKFTFVEGGKLRYSFALHSLGVLMLILSLAFNMQIFFRLASLFFLGSVAVYAYAYNIFERYPGEEYARRMKSRDWIRYRYFTRHVNASGVWLLTSYILLFIYLNLPVDVLIPRLYLWDASLHSLTLGFIVNFIYAYGGIMLPPIILRKAAYKSLRYEPMIFINIALALRVAVDLIPEAAHQILSFIHMILVFISLGFFIVMMRNLFREEVK